MIYVWLILLALVYVVVAIVVGKICAINSRWEKTVDGIDPWEGQAGVGAAKRSAPPSSGKAGEWIGTGGREAMSLGTRGEVEGE